MYINKNIPNYLTMTRVAIIPLIISTFYFKDSILAHRIGGFLFGLATFTDFLDGYIARKYNLVSKFGRMFDPIADKLLVGCVIIMLVRDNRAPVLPCLLILSREFFVAGLREFLAEIRVSIPVSFFAKAKTVIQMFSLFLIILGSKGTGIEIIDQIGYFLLWLAAIMTLITGYSYLKASYKHI